MFYQQLKERKPGHVAAAGAAIVLFAVIVIAVKRRSREDAPSAASPAPVLSVAVTHAEATLLPVRVPATGNVAAWQEASVGSEADGLRLVAVEVNVGDAVKRGDTLARFDTDIVAVELAEAGASVTQFAAQADEAEANARRARSLDRSGALSAQQIDQYVAAAATARARLDAARATEKKHLARLARTRVLAPSDGVITSRSATVGAVVPVGQELFRLIRDGRLEWRAAVAAADLEKLAPGQAATIVVQDRSIRGVVRTIAPVIDTQTREGLVYVDLPHDPAIRAGTFARGYVEVGNAAALTVPRSAVLMRDGFDYVMRVGPASNVVMNKVAVGRQVGDRVEIMDGISTDDAVIAAGLAFLSEGDVVNVVAPVAGGAP